MQVFVCCLFLTRSPGRVDGKQRANKTNTHHPLGGVCESEATERCDVVTSFPALSLASHVIFPSSLPLPALFVYRVFPPLCPLMSHRAGLSRSLRRRSQTSSCLRGLASIGESESAWLRFHSFAQKEKEGRKSHNHVSHIVRRVATGTGGIVLQLVFKGRALLHLRSAAFDARSGRCKHLFLFFFYVLLRATYLPIDHSVPRSAEVSMPTRPAARQKAKRAQWVSETQASLLSPELR